MPERIVANIEKVIFGKRGCIQNLVAAFLAEEHVLLEDVPGVGKTMMAKALARSIDGIWNRIQFTSDLLPADIIGTTIYNNRTSEFEVRKGPIFANVVLADEINRATPRTQSALLESMGEKQISIENITYELPPPFFVIATQNPVYYEGCYPLVESQLDRFGLHMEIGYPEGEDQMRILRENATGAPVERVQPVVDKNQVVEMQQGVRKIHVAEEILRYIAELLAATREHGEISLGASPRCGISLLSIARARAYMEKREFVIPDDIQSLFLNVLRHRIILRRNDDPGRRRVSALLTNILTEVNCPV